MFAVCIQLLIYSHLKRNIIVKLGIELNCFYSVNISKFQENVIKSSKKKKHQTWKPGSCTHFVAKKTPFYKSLEVKMYFKKSLKPVKIWLLYERKLL